MGIPVPLLIHQALFAFPHAFINVLNATKICIIKACGNLVIVYYLYCLVCPRMFSGLEFLLWLNSLPKASEGWGQIHAHFMKVKLGISMLKS